MAGVEGAVMANTSIPNAARSKLSAACSRRELQHMNGLATEVVVAPGKHLCEKSSNWFSSSLVLVSGSISVSLADTVVSQLHSGDSLGRDRIDLTGFPSHRNRGDEHPPHTFSSSNRTNPALSDTSPTSNEH